ncbi:MAG: helix-turn-helix transcriptional regulator [Enterococcus sp.]|nr:helix-turn-helix transcriptional regulator [Enterococcus sp.]
MSNEFELIEHRQSKGVHAFLIDMNYRRPHLHTDLELIYVLKGQLIVQTEGRKITVQEQECLVINSCQLHELLSKEQAKLLILQLGTKEFATFFPQINEISFHNQALNLNERSFFKELLHHLFTTCDSFFQEEDYFALACHGHASLVLYYLLQCAPYELIPEAKQGAHFARQERIRRISHYIQQHYHETLFLADIAEQENLSVNYLSHFFHKNFGLSFQHYLNVIRCEKAYFLLSNTDHGLLYISEACGFSDLRYLNRAFKNLYHQTPKEFRNQMNQRATITTTHSGHEQIDRQHIYSKAESAAVMTELLTTKK